VSQSSHVRATRGACGATERGITPGHSRPRRHGGALGGLSKAAAGPRLGDSDDGRAEPAQPGEV